MDPQLKTNLPIPIIEEIIALSSPIIRLRFRLSCKRFLQIIDIRFFPIHSSSLYNEGERKLNRNTFTPQFNIPSFGVLDSSSTTLLVSDEHSHVIRRINLFTHKVNILCGTPGVSGWRDGMESESRFCYPSGLAVNRKENILFVSDSWNNVIRSVSLIDGRAETIYGMKGISGRKDGIGNEATFHHPEGLALDSTSNHLYVVDNRNHSIRRILLDEGKVETLCGSGKDGYVDGAFEEAMFYSPIDIVFNSLTEELYVSDTSNHIIRTISLKNRTVRTLCGTPQVEGLENGIHSRAKFNFPRGLGLDIHSHCLLVCDTGNHVLRRISLSREAKVTTLCGIAKKQGNRDGLFPTFTYPRGIAMDPHSQSLYVMNYGDNKIRKIIDKTRVLSRSVFPSK